MLVYGLEVPDLAGTDPVGPRQLTWPRLDLVQVEAPSPEITDVRIDDESAYVGVAGTVAVVVRRAAGSGLTAEIRSPRPVDDAELAHPVLAYIASGSAPWLGRTALHGASVRIAGRAWVLLADPEGGKSTLASGLAARGHDVLGDDVAVVDGSTVLAGPRGCDLRVASHEWLGAGSAMASDLLRRTRWRQQLPAAPAEVPLGGFVVLRWGDRSVRRVGAAERMAALLDQRAVWVEPPAGTAFLELMGRPCFEVVRPRRFEALESTVRTIEDIAEHS